MLEKGKQKKLTGILAIILVIFLIAVIWISNLMFDFALNPNSNYTIADLLSTEQSGGEEPNKADPALLEKYYGGADTWFESGQPATQTSEDGLALTAHYFPAEGSHRYVIVCHGYGGNAAQMAGYAMQFSRMGCSVLVPDARAHGESGGEYYGMGWPERRDILGWADQLIDADPDAQIALFGVSMGGATVMMTAGEELPTQIKCIVEDCGYTSVWDEFSVQMKSLFSAPDFPLMYTTDLICQLRAGYGFKEASSVEQLKKAEIPMLFIHGEDDTFVPYSMLEEVYTACASPVKEKLTVPNAAHGTAAYTDPELYWGTVEDFVNRQFS